MNNDLFKDGKPKIKLIVEKILYSAGKHNIAIDSIALVGGWAKEVNTNNSIFTNNIADIDSVEKLISSLDKCKGDVDFVIFGSDIQHAWVGKLLSELNSNIPPDVKDGRVDIVLSQPTSIRPPGIRLAI